MIILVDKNNLITSFATAGGFEDGIEVDNSAFPDTFIAEFKPFKFKYESGVVFYNRDFSDNEEAAQLKSINESLEEKVKKLEEKVVELEATIAAIPKPEPTPLPEETTESNTEAPS